MDKLALYLAGGGARGAYQAGVLKAIGELISPRTLPFNIISGVSVGCINAAVLAENAENYFVATDKLETLWSQIESPQIFNTSNYELSKSVLRTVSNVFVKKYQSGHLLDTTPLYNFISSNIDFDRINYNIENSKLETMEIISHCYERHQTISFYQHHKAEFEDWNYPKHSSLRVKLAADYILASGSLPLFFPPRKIDGFHYGDGSMGLAAPFRGAIRCKADKILIIGTRQLPKFLNYEHLRNTEIGFANILGSMLNGLFLDNLDHDIDTVNRMNEIARLLSLWKKRYSPWRPIKTLYLRPSMDIATIAQDQYNSMPAILRFLLNMLGAKSHSGDLLSFLLFEKTFTQKVFHLGYEDTLAAKDSVLEFFKSN